MKKILTLFLTAAILMSAAATSAMPLHSYEEVIPISKSITLTKVSEFYGSKNISYSYIKADLNDENTAVKLLKSDKGTDILDTVPNLAKTDENTVAAMNADFFSVYSGNKGFSLGIEIDSENMLQSPIYPDTMATISATDNTLSMGYLSFIMAAVAPNGNYEVIRHLNKHTDYYGNIVMYTSDWNGGYSPAPGGVVVEVVVSQGKVTEIRREMPPVEIPKDGCVLVVSEGSSMFFANNFQIGDDIKFDYYVTPDIQKADAAFGGGAMLVSKGETVKTFSHVISGYNPRSAIGMSKDGKTLYMVAVDGRQTKSKGMTMSELAALMKELGCYSAVNLDGGGSTNMVASTIWNKNLTSANSPTENRKVINAVGLSYNADSGAPYELTIKTDKEKVYIGDSVNISAALYDENMRPLTGNVSFKSSQGTISENVFKPSLGGKAVIEATSGSLSAKAEITVVDKIAGIETQSRVKLNMNESKAIELNVFDYDGNYINVKNTSGFKITSSDESVVKAENSKITGLKNGSAVVTVSKDGVQSYISVNVGETDSYMATPQNVYAGISKPVSTASMFRVGAIADNPQTLLSGLTNTAISMEVGAAVSNAVLGASKAFATREDSNALYITINTENGGIRATDSSQWDKIANAIYNTKKENVFILSGNDIFGSNEFENQVIKDYFAKLYKNIFVVTGGDSNSYKNIDGVKYFTILNTEKDELSMQRMENYKYLEFYFGNEISFEWKSIY